MTARGRCVCPVRLSLTLGLRQRLPCAREKVFPLFDRLGDLASEHAELERALADPGVHADADQARTLAKRYAELTPIVNAYREWQQVGDDEQAALELADRGSRLRAGGRRAGQAPRGAGGTAPQAARAQGPERRPRHHPRGQGGRGRRRVRLVRRRPAADVPALRRAARLEDGDHRLDRHRPRRRQGRDRRGQGGPGRHRGLVPAEVRGRRAPGAAGPGHRVAGPHPHLRRGRARHPRGRPGRRARSTTTT